MTSALRLEQGGVAGAYLGSGNALPSAAYTLHPGSVSKSTAAANPTTDDLADSALDAAIAGDPEAFASLYRAIAGRVYRFCLFRVGREVDAEDLTQVVFLKIVEALPRYERRGIPFSVWVFRIARNVVTDFQRAHADHVGLDAVAECADRDGGDMGFRALDDRDTLRWALRGLTAEQREVIAYRFIADLTTREIATLVGRREGAIRALQWRALDALRHRLVTADR